MLWGYLIAKIFPENSSQFFWIWTNFVLVPWGDWVNPIVFEVCDFFSQKLPIFFQSNNSRAPNYVVGSQIKDRVLKVFSFLGSLIYPTCLVLISFNSPKLELTRLIKRKTKNRSETHPDWSSDKGSLAVRKVQFFWTLFKKPLTPPPPLSFEHHVVNFMWWISCC